MPKPELSNKTNGEFPIRGVNHLALVCKDMKRTVDFYTGVLGMPLVKTIELPGNMGQHFFFDIGNGDSLAFFWFPNAPEAVPGVSAPAVKGAPANTRRPSARTGAKLNFDGTIPIAACARMLAETSVMTRSTSRNGSSSDSPVACTAASSGSVTRSIIALKRSALSLKCQ